MKRMTESEVRKFRLSYIEEFPVCQYHIALGRYIRVPGASRSPRRSEICVEHLMGRKGPASEHWSNYASVCDPCHRWRHENQAPARVAIFSFKLDLAKKTGDWRHFDLQAIREASGYHLPGWIEWRIPQLPEWCVPIAMDLLEGIESIR